MIMGADVCHKVAGISVAAVVGTTDFSFVAWLWLMRGDGDTARLMIINVPDVIFWEGFLWEGLDIELDID